MRAIRVSEKPSLCLALMGGVLPALLGGVNDKPQCVSQSEPARFRRVGKDGKATQTLVLRLNSVLFFKEFI